MPDNPLNIFKKPKGGYRSKLTPEYEQAAYSGIAGRVGAQKTPEGGYDFGKAFSPITGQAGVRKATRGYDFSGLQKAQQGFQQPVSLGRASFSRLPSQYGRQAYERGSADIRREGEAGAENIRRSMGTRRLGLLGKALQSQQKAVGGNLANLRRDIGLERMRQDVDLGREQQLANLGQQAMEEQFRQANLGNLARVGSQQIALQQGLVGAERDYMDRALQMLQNMFGTAAGTTNQAAQIDAQNRASNLNFLSSLIGG